MADAFNLNWTAGRLFRFPIALLGGIPGEVLKCLDQLVSFP